MSIAQSFGIHLSPMQARIVETIIAFPGLTAKELAIHLGTSDQTIEVQIMRIRKHKKFSIDNGFVFKEYHASPYRL